MRRRLDQDFLQDIKGGLVASTAGIAFSIANGAVIYSGTLQPMLARGIGAGLLTTAIICIMLAVTSGFRAVVGTANSATAAPLGAIMASIAPALVILPQDQAIATVYALVAVTTLTTGAVLLLLGTGRLGNIVRFLPHPVVAGFMGVSGTLLLLGAIRFGTGVAVQWRNLPRFLDGDIALELSLGVAFAVFTTLVTRRARHPLALPILLVTTIVGVNLVMRALHPPPESDLLKNFFLAPRTAMPLVTPILFDFSAPPIAWDLVWPQFPAIAAYSLLVVLSTLLTSVGLESAMNTDINFDRELRAQGLAVIVSGASGGFIGNASVGSTLAALASGARGRITGIMAGVTALLFLVLGQPLLPYIPRFVIAGFLLEVGFWTVFAWCWNTRKQMAPGEYALVLAIVAITVWIGLVPAILVGIVGGCILFALDLSRIDIVRRVYGLDMRASPLVRSREELEVLAQDGGKVQFIELNGTLFFGSAYQMLARLRRMIAQTPPTQVVIDFTRVIGGDSSTSALLARMRRLLADRNIGFAIAGARPALVAQLRSSGALQPEDVAFASRDEALEAKEAFVLASSSRDDLGPTPLTEWLTDALGQPDLAAALIPYLKGVDHAPGDYLCREGEPTTTLLFIESGRVAVTIGPPDDETVVRVFGPRTVAGEHGFVLRLPRTASLRVEKAARVWALERRDFDALSARQPALVIALLQDIVKLQSERLAFATRQNAVLA